MLRDISLHSFSFMFALSIPLFISMEFYALSLAGFLGSMELTKFNSSDVFAEQ